jgi:hypothetical protein
MPTDGIARRYVTVLEDEGTPLQLAISTMYGLEADASARTLANLSLEPYPVEALKNLLFGMFAPPYYPYPDYIGPRDAFRFRDRAYDVIESFVERVLEQPIAIEQSPVSGKSLQALAKRDGVVLKVAATTGLASSCCAFFRAGAIRWRQHRRHLDLFGCCRRDGHMDCQQDSQ